MKRMMEGLFNTRGRAMRRGCRSGSAFVGLRFAGGAS
jgi:hypothetical protein